MQNVLVTGAAGFIGAALVKKLCEIGLQVTGVDNISDYYLPKLKEDRMSYCLSHKNYRFHVVDINHYDDLSSIFRTEKPDTVFHLAAQPGVRYSVEHPEGTFHHNVDGFFNILECCREFGVEKLLYASSSSVYGNEEPKTEHYRAADHPVSLYAATKRCNELLAYSYYHCYKFDCIGLRYFTVYGPWGRPDMAVYKFIDALLNNKTIKLFNHGRNKRNFTYIDDAVNATIQVAEHLNGYQVIDIGSGDSIDTNTLLETIERHTQRETIKEYLCEVDGDVLSTRADKTLLQSISDQYQWVPLDEGITKTVQWYKNYYRLS